MIPRARLARFVNEGRSDVQIARLEGVSARTVLRWRQHYSMPSQWIPPRTARHGTVSRYQSGCKCRDCSAANAHAASERRRRLNHTTRHAPSYGLPWTASDDLELSRGPGTVLDRAVRLGRTYGAAVQRLEQLRRRGVDVDALEDDDTTGPT